MVTACPITSIDSELLASVEVRKRRTVMTWGKRLGITSRFVFTTAAALALALTLVAPVRADHFNHVRSWSGTLAGSIIGGAIGSTIGQGRGRLVAVGAGALLGGLYGRHLARDHRHLRAHHHSWHGHRAITTPGMYITAHGNGCTRATFPHRPRDRGRFSTAQRTCRGRQLWPTTFLWAPGALRRADTTPLSRSAASSKMDWRPSTCAEARTAIGTFSADQIGSEQSLPVSVLHP